MEVAMSEAITAIATITATIIIVVGTGLLLGSSYRVPLRHMDHRLQDIRMKAARTHRETIVAAVGRYFHRQGIHIRW